jgi:hypothetical protein
MWQSYFADAGARHNDMIYFTKPTDWRFQLAM